MDNLRSRRETVIAGDDRGNVGNHTIKWRNVLRYKNHIFEGIFHDKKAILASFIYLMMYNTVLIFNLLLKLFISSSFLIYREHLTALLLLNN